MGIRAILEAVRRGVASVQPKSIAAVGFTCPPGHYSSDPYEWAAQTQRALREYTVALGRYPHQAEGSGPCLLDATLTVVVTYPHRELPGEERHVVVAEDQGLLVRALLQQSLHWGGADSIWPDGHPSVEEYGDERPVHRALFMPLRVRFREE